MIFFCPREESSESELSGRSPVSHFWDESEPRLFVCETVPVSSETSSEPFLDMVREGYLGPAVSNWIRMKIIKILQPILQS